MRITTYVPFDSPRAANISEVIETLRREFRCEDHGTIIRLARFRGCKTGLTIILYDKQEKKSSLYGELEKLLRCEHCGADGHAGSDCRLKKDGDKELATEAKRRRDWKALEEKHGPGWHRFIKEK